MIIQIGTEVDESRILWKHKESDEWERADIDDLIEAYENRQKEPKPGDLISRQALIDEVLDDGNGAVLSYPAGMYEDDLVERIEKQMIQHFIGVIEYAPPVEPKQSELHIDEPRGYTLKTDKAEVYSKRPKDCRMRSANGNCCPMGGFCTSNSMELCEAMQNAYENGRNDIIIEILQK